jgi:triacylglycerol lipase
MLPAIPITLFLIEWVLCFTVGMHLFGDTAMRRLGELSTCVVLWIFGVRILSVAFSFVAAKRLNTRSIQQPWHRWLVTVFHEAWSIVIGFSLFIPLRRIFAPRLSVRDYPGKIQGKTIILLVHGLLSNSGIWFLFARRLARRTGALIDSVDLGPTFQSIDRSVPRLHERLRQLEQLSPAKIVLIGHSMGGLACRAWLQSNSKGSVSQLITLGTPHQGSMSALILPFTNLREMRPSSAWLKALSPSCAVPTTCIFSRHDNLVIPFDNGRFDGAMPEELTGLGHLSLLFDRATSDLVSKLIIK